MGNSLFEKKAIISKNDKVNRTAKKENVSTKATAFFTRMNVDPQKNDTKIRNRSMGICLVREDNAIPPDRFVEKGNTSYQTQQTV